MKRLLNRPERDSLKSCETMFTYHSWNEICFELWVSVLNLSSLEFCPSSFIIAAVAAWLKTAACVCETDVELQSPSCDGSIRAQRIKSKPRSCADSISPVSSISLLPTESQNMRRKSKNNRVSDPPLSSCSISSVTETLTDRGFCTTLYHCVNTYLLLMTWKLWQ